MSSLKHNHIYKKAELATNPGKEFPVYKCIKPGCTHYLRKELLLDRVAECPICNTVFVVKKVHLSRRVLIKCMNCREKKNVNKAIEGIDSNRLKDITTSLLSRVLKESGEE